MTPDLFCSWYKAYDEEEEASSKLQHWDTVVEHRKVVLLPFIKKIALVLFIKV